MTSRQERQDERDWDLMKALAGAAEHLRKDIHEWIQEELVSLATELDIVTPTTNGMIHDQCDAARLRVTQIDQHELNQAIQQYRTWVDTVEARMHSNPFDAHRELNTGLNPLRDMINELVQIRQLVDGLGGVGDGPPDRHPDFGDGSPPEHRL